MIGSLFQALGARVLTGVLVWNGVITISGATIVSIKPGIGVVVIGDCAVTRSVGMITSKRLGTEVALGLDVAVGKRVGVGLGVPNGEQPPVKKKNRVMLKAIFCFIKQIFHLAFGIFPCHVLIIPVLYTITVTNCAFSLRGQAQFVSGGIYRFKDYTGCRCFDQR